MFKAFYWLLKEGGFLKRFGALECELKWFMDRFAFTIVPRAEILKLHDDSLLLLFNNVSDGINGAPGRIHGFRGRARRLARGGCRGDGVTVANLRHNEK